MNLVVCIPFAVHPQTEVRLNKVALINGAWPPPKDKSLRVYIRVSLKVGTFLSTRLHPGFEASKS